MRCQNSREYVVNHIVNIIGLQYFAGFITPEFIVLRVQGYQKIKRIFVTAVPSHQMSQKSDQKDAPSILD